MSEKDPGDDSSKDAADGDLNDSARKKVSEDEGELDVERGDEATVTVSRRPTFGQRIRHRIRTGSSLKEVYDGPPKTKRHNPNSYPRGYPRLAAYVDSDTNTHLYRRFGYMRNRTLLYVQDELVWLERKLAKMDALDDEAESFRLACRTFDEEDDPKRKHLMEEIKAKLKEYDDLLVREQSILKFERPGRRNHQHFISYLWQEKPLDAEDEEYAYYREDMVNLYTYPESQWLYPMIDAILLIVPPWLMRLLFTKRKGEDTIDNTHQYKEGRLEFVVKLFVLLLSMVLLLVPVVLLYILTIGPWVKIGIIFIFVALFTAVTLFMTQARRHEIFVSIATYCAVLVVFLGNLPQQ